MNDKPESTESAAMRVLKKKLQPGQYGIPVDDWYDIYCEDITKLGEVYVSGWIRFDADNNFIDHYLIVTQYDGQFAIQLINGIWCAPYFRWHMLIRDILDRYQTEQDPGHVKRIAGNL